MSASPISPTPAPNSPALDSPALDSPALDSPALDSPALDSPQHGCLSELLSQAGSSKILVLGDLMLDQYTIGDAGRVSQEAPILVLKAEQQHAMLGGAANVANMLRGLGVEVSVAGVVGSDAGGEQLQRHLAEAGVYSAAVVTDTSRCTTVKQRFVGRTHGRNSSQLLRVDHECCDPIAPPLCHRLSDSIKQQLPDLNVVLISDYAKGVGVPSLLQEVIGQCRALGIPTLVDPARGLSFDRYRGATLIKPNRSEAASAFGSAIRNIDEAVQAAVWLCQEYDIEMAIITLDRDGMVLAKSNGDYQHFPTEARSVYDITGAGDMVLAALGLGFAAGGTPREAIHLANVAAGLEVEREGVAVITPDEILAQLPSDVAPSKCVDCRQAGVLAEKYRQQGKRVVFTNGCFDLLHAGHVTSLKEAAAFGDVLFVGVNADETIRQLKGADRPVIGEQERMAVLAALECVQHVVLFAEQTPHDLLHSIRPDVLVKGGTYREDEVVGHEVVRAYGGQIRVTNVVGGMSTTKIVARVIDRAA
jgi:D-beta-D-heptose 7-phosphate kinase/D-beta-D-heptose 1-phosphate adenosyltransferase